MVDDGKIRLMFVSTTFGMGGAEIQVYRLAKAFKKRGYDITCVSLTNLIDELMLHEVENIGIRFYTLGLDRGEVSLKACLEFIKIVKEENSNIIHSHMYHANVFCRILKPFLGGASLINTIHGEEELTPKRMFSYKILSPFVSHTTCCGEVLYDKAVNRVSKESKLSVIYNGLDTDLYKNNRDERRNYRYQLGVEGAFVWINVGRLSKVKNQEYLIREFSKIDKDSYNCKLIIAGGGEEERNLRKLIIELGEGENILLLGSRNDIRSLLNMADAFVLSSIHEGLPLSLQEAACSGLPIISTDVGGCCEVVENETNGLICKSNAPDGLSICMKKIMDLDNERYKEMQNNSVMISKKKYDIERIVNQWETLYGKYYEL